MKEIKRLLEVRLKDLLKKQNKKLWNRKPISEYSKNIYQLNHDDRWLYERRANQ